jgi:cytoskeletal protein CcmA (bactofilin family)
VAEPTTIIAAGTALAGRLTGAEDVAVLGRVSGSIELEGELFVDAQGRVDATCQVTALDLHGILVGDLNASAWIELHPTARVIGNLVAPRVIVHPGAKVRGLVDSTAGAEAGAPRAAAPAARATPVGRTTPAASRTEPRRPEPAPAPRRNEPLPVRRPDPAPRVEAVSPNRPPERPSERPAERPTERAAEPPPSPPGLDPALAQALFAPEDAPPTGSFPAVVDDDSAAEGEAKLVVKKKSGGKREA